MINDYLVLMKVIHSVGTRGIYRFHLEVVASDETRAKTEALHISREEFPNAIVYAVDCHRVYDDPPVGWLEYFKNLFKR